MLGERGDDEGVFVLGQEVQGAAAGRLHCGGGAGEEVGQSLGGMGGEGAHLVFLKMRRGGERADYIGIGAEGGNEV